jgi:hypothetical protein
MPKWQRTASQFYLINKAGYPSGTQGPMLTYANKLFNSCLNKHKEGPTGMWYALAGKTWRFLG